MDPLSPPEASEAAADGDGRSPLPSGASERLGALLEEKLEEKLAAAARHLRAHPAAPGWVVWRAGEVDPLEERHLLPGPGGQLPGLAAAARRHGLFVQPVAVRSPDGRSLQLLLACRRTPPTPRQIAEVLAACRRYDTT